jgi:2-dehydro-3-deoxygluconokinase
VDSAARILARDRTALKAASMGADIKYFSSITLEILPEADINTLITFLRRFCAFCGIIAFDPNLHPHLWSDKNVVLSAVMDAASISDIVLPSYNDKSNWFDDANLIQTAQR